MAGGATSQRSKGVLSCPAGISIRFSGARRPRSAFQRRAACRAASSLDSVNRSASGGRENPRFPWGAPEAVSGGSKGAPSPRRASMALRRSVSPRPDSARVMVLCATPHIRARASCDNDFTRRRRNRITAWASRSRTAAAISGSRHTHPGTHAQTQEPSPRGRPQFPQTIDRYSVRSARCSSTVARVCSHGNRSKASPPCPAGWGTNAPSPNSTRTPSSRSKATLR